MFNSMQRHRVNRAVNYARQYTSDTFDLDLLADVACLSKYHFSRVFSVYMHETPGQYVNRLRLERAAGDLIRMAEKPVTQIGLDGGFSGSDVFSRAFRNRFGVSPRRFRALRQAGFDAFDHKVLIREQIRLPGNEISPEEQQRLEISVEHRPEYQVAYIRRLGPYGDVNNSITRSFDTLLRWAETRGILGHKTSFLGHGTDDCSITPARYCSYDTCLVLNDLVREDDIVSLKTVPGGKFAVLRTVCEPQQVNRHWEWLIGGWLPASGRALLRQPCYEFFPEWGKQSVSPRCGIELCIPVSAPEFQLKQHRVKRSSAF